MEDVFDQHLGQQFQPPTSVTDKLNYIDGCLEVVFRGEDVLLGSGNNQLLKKVGRHVLFEGPPLDF